MRRLPVLLAALLLGLALPAATLAAECPKTTLGDVEDEVMCPVCGVPLELATEAPQANAERRFIVRQIEACKSKQEIKDALVAQFGDAVLATPKSEGFALTAYLVPVLALLAALAAIALALTRWRRARPAAEAPAPLGPEPDPEDSARLDADMRRSGI